MYLKTTKEERNSNFIEHTLSQVHGLWMGDSITNAYSTGLRKRKVTVSGENNTSFIMK